MENIEIYISYTAKIVEIAGIITIVVGTILAFYRYFAARQNASKRSYKKLRQELGKGILLGLEILVAADIIATVVTEPTLEKVITLGLIVLIRTFLSFSMELEIEGRFPWQRESSGKRFKD